jgi:hypothetical protein
VLNWHIAKAAAEASFLYGTPGHLVTLASAAEEDFIRVNFGVQSLWLGLTDEVSEGTFAWVTGEPFVYANLEAPRLMEAPSRIMRRLSSSVEAPLPAGMICFQSCKGLHY